ncbi:MAG: FAD-binding oxidoreductase [Candidatus Lokiarchaeota archaeon]|nr:FAD-binding oxidoreductase [Candidatus Lokiarchaeota archaeon]
MVEYGEVNDEIIKDLQNTVGKEFVSTDKEDLLIYGADMTEEEPRLPDAIAMPNTPEEIQKILLIANKSKIPVVPYITAANIGGLTIPMRGGIVIDLKRMDRIIKADENSKYIVVEPNVSFGKLKVYLDKNHPDFMYSYAFSPPHTSVMANALLEGLTEYSYRYGSMGDFIVGLEAVLPTGEITKIGSCAMTKTDHWNMKYPLPEMSGLFVGWQGMTGIATKIAVKMLPKPPIIEKNFVLYFNEEDMFNFLTALTKTDLIQGDFNFSFQTVMMMGGEKHPVRELNQNDPVAISGIYTFAYNKKDKATRVKILQELANKHSTNPKKPIQFMPINLLGKYSNILELPLSAVYNANFMEYRSGIKQDDQQLGAGMSWIGTFAPISSFRKGYRGGYEIMEKHGFTPLIFTKMMDSGHFMVIRYLIPFQKPKDNKAVRKLNEEIVDFILDEVGAIPYKCPSWAAEKVLKRIDPNWIKMAKKIKGALDPNWILNPGRWSLMPE